MSVPHLGTPASRHKGRKGLVSYPSALLALACFIGFAILWLLHKEGGSPGEWLSTSTTLSPRYQTAAAANITAWKNRLLSEVLPTFSTRVNATVGFSHADWTLFSDPVISCPADRPLKRFGKGTDDGTKLLCDVGGLRGRGGAPCLIYSMGSAGNFLFEEAMLSSTTCDIHTFDCTYEGASILPGRHYYWKWCIGNPGLGIASGLTFKSWDDVTRDLHHDYVNLLKVDIEGHEYPVLAALQAGSQRVLPDEMSIEIHARYVSGWAATHLEGSWQNGLNLPHTPGDMALVFMHLANQGYGVYSAEENYDWFMCCSEFSLLRIPAAAANAAGGGSHFSRRSHRRRLK